MKLILKQYLASLRERYELDAVLPDLLSQMGLNVFSKPGRGTRQYGVDVAAVGSINGEPDKVYLFSIKLGDLTRASWDGPGIQSLRPSLNEIRDSYIPHRLPHEHEDKQLVICICFGGDIQEQVRTNVEGYFKENSTERISFEEWNGDKLAELIQANFLREDLLPSNSRPLLRKALALLDEPEASFKHYVQLISGFLDVAIADHSEKLKSIRQFSICLWILFAWSRDIGNLESAYLSAERTLLYAWELTKDDFYKNTKAASAIREAFQSVLLAYLQVADDYIPKRILPLVTVFDGLSSAVNPSSSIDVNLKLFDVLGRVAIYGLWAIWRAETTEDKDQKEELILRIKSISNAIKSMIVNNPILLLPIKDEQAIDIFLAMMHLAASSDNQEEMKIWLSEIIRRAKFAYNSYGPYPCTICDYSSLLDHPLHGDEDYRKEVTMGSLLYSIVALWAAILEDIDVYKRVLDFKNRCLQHCNFQLWYPDEATETNLYTNKDLHGATLSYVPVDRPMAEFLKVVWDECDQMQHFEHLSAYEKGFWPLITVACRHYRIPLPVDFTLIYRENNHGKIMDPK